MGKMSRQRRQRLIKIPGGPPAQQDDGRRPLTDEQVMAIRLVQAMQSIRSKDAEIARLQQELAVTNNQLQLALQRESVSEESALAQKYGIPASFQWDAAQKWIRDTTPRSAAPSPVAPEPAVADPVVEEPEAGEKPEEGA